MSGKWLTDVHITDVDGTSGWYELEEDLVYRDKHGLIWITPAGFQGDLSSIPPAVRPFIPVTVLGKAPWLHDYLYRFQIRGVTRKDADRLYREGAKAEGMSKRQANLLYAGLRIGGWAGWNMYKKALANDRRSKVRE